MPTRQIQLVTLENRRISQLHISIHLTQYLGVPCKPVSHEPLIVSGSCVKGHVERFVEELVVCDIVADMNYRIILCSLEPALKLDYISLESLSLCFLFTRKSLLRTDCVQRSCCGKAGPCCQQSAPAAPTCWMGGARRGGSRMSG